VASAMRTTKRGLRAIAELAGAEVQETDGYPSWKPNLDSPLLAHLISTAQTIGKAQMAAFKPARIGLVLVGLEVPHVHFHVVPISGVHDLDFDNQDPNPDPAVMTSSAEAIRAELSKLGHAEGANAG